MQQQDSSHPTGVSAPKGNRDKEVIRSRDRKANAAIQMRLAHATWDEVAEVLGFPTARAALVAVEKALEKQLDRPESRDEMRLMAGKRLDRLARAVWTKAIDPDHPEQMVAVTKARELIADHRKLFGLDAPTEVVVHSPTTQELEAWVARAIQIEIPAVEEADIFGYDDIVEGEIVEGTG